MGRQKKNKTRRGRDGQQESVSERVARQRRYAEENGLFNDQGEWWEDGQLMMIHPSFLEDQGGMKSLPPDQVVTREPNPVLPGWPKTHVDVELTGMDEDECFRVRIHGVEHMLHATTARALSNALLEQIGLYNQGVQSALADPATRALIESQLEGWIGPNGEKPTIDDMTV
jgi:hypothetical protein